MTEHPPETHVPPPLPYAGPLTPPTLPAPNLASATSRAVGITFAVMLLCVNGFSIFVAAGWSISSWREYLDQRSWWSLWPLVWLIGSAVIASLQLFASVLPSISVASRGRDELHWSVRLALVLSALAGLLIIIGGFAAICIHSRVTPAPHRIGP